MFFLVYLVHKKNRVFFLVYIKKLGVLFGVQKEHAIFLGTPKRTHRFFFGKKEHAIFLGTPERTHRFFLEGSVGSVRGRQRLPWVEPESGM